MYIIPQYYSLDFTLNILHTTTIYKKYLNILRSVKKWDPPYPKISKIVVDAIIWHWMKVVAPTGADAEGIRKTVQELVE